MASVAASSCLTETERTAELAKFKEPREKRLVTWIALFYAVVCLLIGMPVWWRTTSTYRAWLPTSDIEALSSGPESHLTLAIRVVVLSFDSWIDVPVLAEFEIALFDELSKNSQSNRREASQRVTIDWHGFARPSNRHENEVFQTSLKLKDFESGLHTMHTLSDSPNTRGSSEDAGDEESGTTGGDTYYFVLLPNSTRLLQEGKRGLVRAGSKVSYVRVADDLNDVRSLIVRLMRKVFVREDELEETFSSAFHLPNAVAHSNDQESPAASADRLRQLRSSSAYEVTFSLVNPSPELMTAHWDILSGARLYLDPFLARLTRYISVSVKSQYLFCVDLDREGRRSREEPDKTGFYYLPEDLPHLINPLESHMGSRVSATPGLNMVVYLPSPNHSPLTLRDKTGKPISTNSFISPQWGSLLVYNRRDNATDVQIDVQSVMEVAVPQLKALLGVYRRVPRILLPLEPADVTGVTQWELDSWLRRRTLENVARATATLASLVDLIDKVSYMVISDTIGGQVYGSVHSLHQAREALSAGQLQTAYLSSRRALTLAETAFFDPSLLELLYFQDDQKYGIYMPLFIPLCVPLLLSTVRAVRYLLAERKKMKEA